MRGIERPSGLVGVVGEREVAQLVERVGGVGDQLAEEDLRVRVERVDDELEELADFGLEFSLDMASKHNYKETWRRRTCPYRTSSAASPTQPTQLDNTCPENTQGEFLIWSANDHPVNSRILCDRFWLSAKSATGLAVTYAKRKLSANRSCLLFCCSRLNSSSSGGMVAENGPGPANACVAPRTLRDHELKHR